MSAPERIMAWPSFGPNSVTGEWSANTYYDERAEEYVRADTVATLIAQARAEAREACAAILDESADQCELFAGLHADEGRERRSEEWRARAQRRRGLAAAIRARKDTQ